MTRLTYSDEPRDIWIVAETKEGALTALTKELVYGARMAADMMGFYVKVALLGSSVSDLAGELYPVGADRALWIRSEGGDASVIANLIAAAARKIGEIDLIIAGHQALDTGAGELAPRVAEALDWPQILGVAKLEAGTNGVTAIVQQAGFVQVEAPVPVVVAMLAEAYRGSYADGWRLMDAYKKWNIEAWSTADLDLGEDDLRPLTIKKEDAFPPERQPGTLVRDVKELVVMLKRERAIA